MSRRASISTLWLGLTFGALAVAGIIARAYPPVRRVQVRVAQPPGPAQRTSQPDIVQIGEGLVFTVVDTGPSDLERAIERLERKEILLDTEERIALLEARLALLEQKVRGMQKPRVIPLVRGAGRTHPE